MKYAGFILDACQLTLQPALQYFIEYNVNEGSLEHDWLHTRQSSHAWIALGNTAGVFVCVRALVSSVQAEFMTISLGQNRQLVRKKAGQDPVLLAV